MFRNIHVRWNNISIKKKLLSVVIIDFCLVFFALILCLHFYSIAVDRVLYQALMESVSSVTSRVESHLESIEQMSDNLFAEESIQNNLVTLKEQKGTRAGQDAWQAIYNVLMEYTNTYRLHYVDYIGITQGAAHIQYRTTFVEEKSAQLQEEIVQLANEKEGGARWITEYSENHGLFLGRSIRRIERLKLDLLGTMLVGVDIVGMMEECTDFSQYSEIAYILSDENHVICHSSELELPLDFVENMKNYRQKSYEVIELNGQDYFVVLGKISRTKWNYALMLRYDEVMKTLSFSRFLNIVVIVVTMMISILIFHLLLNSILGHMGSLVMKMQMFAENELEYRKPDYYDYSHRMDEVGKLHVQFDAMAERIKELIRNNYVSELLRKDAQLKALEMEINPHFLYNTLSAINWRAKALREQEISVMVEALSHILRTTLSRQELSYRLVDELELVRSYIAIQKIRYDDRLEFVCRVETDVIREFPLPKLVLQPLVENAVNHALENTCDVCRIELDITQEERQLCIQVKNTQSQFEENLLERLEKGEIKPEGFGIGLLNVHKRLLLFYGDHVDFKLYNLEDMAVVEILLPLEENKIEAFSGRFMVGGENNDEADYSRR